MIIYKILGAAMISVPITVIFLRSDSDTRAAMIKGVFCLLMIAMVIFGLLLLAGCTTTRTVEVPVPIPCAAPKSTPPPHDYLAALKPNAAPADFVRACLATRESYRGAYEACEIARGTIK